MIPYWVSPTVKSPFSLWSVGHQYLGTKGAEAACRALYDCACCRNSIAGVSFSEPAQLYCSVSEIYRTGIAIGTSPNGCSWYATFEFGSSVLSHSWEHNT